LVARERTPGVEAENERDACTEQRSPPTTCRPGLDEHVRCLTPELVVRRQDRMVAGAGEHVREHRLGRAVFVYGPRDVPHTFVVSSPEARFLLVTEPAGFEGFLRAMGQSAPTLTIPPPAAPPSDLTPLVAAAAEYGIDIIGPPGIPS
jgi:hypothetical protein